MNISFFFKCTSIWLAMLILQGCEPSMPETRGMSYLRQSPLELPVRSIEVCVGSCANTSSPGILSIGLLDIVKQWAREYLCARGCTGHLKLTIMEASVQDVPLASDSGFEKLWRITNTEKYCGRVHIKFEYKGPPLDPSFEKMMVTISGEKYVAENYRISERRALLLSLYEDLINRLTSEVNKAVLPYTAFAP